MTAVYKRELKSYLTSMVGYLFIFFVLIVTGIYFSAYQLAAAYPKFEYTLSALTFIFLIGVPILSMRVLAEERKQKTDQLLLTAPVSVGSIVMGKYLCNSCFDHVCIPSDHVKIWSRFFCVCLYGNSGIFPSWLCKPCNRRIYVCSDRKPGCSCSSYFCIAVCFLYDGRNFFFLFPDVCIYLHCVWTSDRGGSHYYLYHDKKYFYLCDNRYCGRSGAGSHLLCKTVCI